MLRYLKQRSPSVLIAGLVIILSIPRHAIADDSPSFAVITITNRSDKALTYQFKWGKDSKWENNPLAAGKSRQHTIRAIEKNDRATWPTPYVRYNKILGGDASTMKEYRLDAKEVLDFGGVKDAEGFRYSFTVKNGTDVVFTANDLVDE